jgi:hypothetical protein
MTVYVDMLFQITPRTKQAQKHGNQWCHLFTDSEDLTELHELADKIGLKRPYFQNPNRKSYKFPHYDLTPAKRDLAISNGAVEIELREFIKQHFQK